jgi:hypothetical protein
LFDVRILRVVGESADEDLLLLIGGCRGEVFFLAAVALPAASLTLAALVASLVAIALVARGCISLLLNIWQRCWNLTVKD